MAASFDSSPSEKTIQAQIVALLRAAGGAVFVLGTRRRRGLTCPRCGAFVPSDHSTRQTPGVPDLEAFLPARGRSGRVLLKVECKASGGRLRPEQAAYRALCLEAAVPHLLGGLDAAIAWLAANGYVRDPSGRSNPEGEPR